MAKGRDPFIDECILALQRFGVTTVRPMFGCHGVYLDGLFVAIIEGGMIYGKADLETVPEWIARGSRPFTYQANGKVNEMRYYVIHGEALSDPGELKSYLDLILPAAERAFQRKKGSVSKKRSNQP